MRIVCIQAGRSFSKKRLKSIKKNAKSLHPTYYSCDRTLVIYFVLFIYDCTPTEQYTVLLWSDLVLKGQSFNLPIIDCGLPLYIYIFALQR